MLLLTINRKPYMASLMTPSLLTLRDLERSKPRSLRFSVVGYLTMYGIYIFASSNITIIWMSQKGVCWRAGFSAVPAVFLVIYTIKYSMRKRGTLVSLTATIPTTSPIRSSASSRYTLWSS